MLRRFVLVITAALVGVLLGSTPTGAIETATFGLDVAAKTEDARLHIDLAAGTTSTGRILVWNKQTAPLRLRLSVSPATVDDAGKVSLGGTDTDPVDWVDVDDEIELAPEERRELDVDVRAPRKLDGRVRTVVIVAEPAPADGAAPPAVLQRLALTTYLEPDQDSLIASLGPFPWIAVAILLVVIGAVVRTNASRKQKAGAPPIG